MKASPEKKIHVQIRHKKGITQKGIRETGTVTKIILNSGLTLLRQFSIRYQQLVLLCTRRHETIFDIYIRIIVFSFAFYCEYYLELLSSKGIDIKELLERDCDHCVFSKIDYTRALHTTSSCKTKKIITVKEVCILALKILTILLRRLLFYFVSIRKIYQTRESVVHRLSRHLECCQKYSAARRIFNFLLGIWIS